MLRTAKRLGSDDPSDMSPSGLFDSFPVKAWGFIFLIVGFFLQAVGSGTFCTQFPT
jgi:hypothetical protein